MTSVKPARKAMPLKIKILAAIVVILTVGGVAAGVAIAISSSGAGDPVSTVRTEAVLSGSITDFTSSVQDALRAKIASELGVNLLDVSLIIVPASVRVTIEVSFMSATEASRASATLSTQMTSTNAASAFLSTSVFAVTVESIVTAPVVVAAEGSTPSSPSAPAEGSSPSSPAAPANGSTPPSPAAPAEGSNGGGVEAATCLTHPCWSDTPAQTPTLKILCLHGGDSSGNGAEFAGLTSAFPSDVTFVYPNGGYSGSSAGSYLWVPDPPGGKGQPTQNLDVADVSVDALNEVVAQQGPFDGIIGYSQGSMMVLYYLSRVPLGTFRFALMFCGYVPNTHQGMVTYIDEASPITTPAFIFAGSTDYIISNTMTAEQRDKFASASREYYVGQGVGHIVPGSGNPGYTEAVAFINQYKS